MMKRKSIIAVGVMCIMALVISVSWAQRAPETKVLKLGMHVPLSGGGAAWGTEHVDITSIAINEINEAGGIIVGGQKYIFELVAYDNKYQGAAAAEVTNRMVYTDKVYAIIGSVGSTPVVSSQAITEPSKILTFTSGSAPILLGPKKYYTFRSMMGTLEITKPGIEFLKKRFPQAKTVALLAANDETGRSVAEISRKAYEEFGFRVILNEFYERGTVDFVPIFTKIKVQNPDIVDNCQSGPNDIGLLAKAAAEVKWKGISWSPVCSVPEALIQAGGAAAEGWLMGYWTDYGGPLATKKLNELNRKYKAKSGLNLGDVGFGVYEATHILAQALRRAGSLDSDKVIQVLEKAKDIKTSWDRPLVLGGEKDYGIKRQFLWPQGVAQIQGGKAVQVGVIEHKE